MGPFVYRSQKASLTFAGQNGKLGVNPTNSAVQQKILLYDNTVIMLQIHCAEMNYGMFIYNDQY